MIYCIFLFFFVFVFPTCYYFFLSYEFAESVRLAAVPGLDPEFYHFMEYLRACLLVAMTKHVGLRNRLLLLCGGLVFAIE